MISVTLDKSYGEARVLRGATLDVVDGSVHALVGENGAGKSTLVKIVAGIVPADGGSLSVGAALRGMASPADAGRAAAPEAVRSRTLDLARWDRRAARDAGVGIVQQHGAFAGTLSVVENAVLGTEGGPLLELAPTAKALAELGERVGLPIDPWARCDALSLGAAQRAEIVAALHAGAKLLILDEPTAVLAPVEVDGLLATLRALAKDGTTIVLVTHKLDEVRAVADAVTVLRAGQTVATFGKDAPSGDIARAMVGAELPAPSRVDAPGSSARTALELAGVGVPRALFDISLTVRAGELVGVAGVDGNGQRELARAIAGLEPCTGRIAIAGRDVSAASVRDRLAAGLAHVPEDRHHGGLVLDATIAENLALGRADVTGRFAIDRAAVARFADARIAELDIRPPDPAAIARTLSGGNQQKIVIGRELSRPKLAAVVASQPTRGVDLGAVLRIHDQLRAAAKAGAGVLVISADLDELLALCHRIVVLLRGRIVGEAAAAAGARDTLGELMTGATA